MAQRIKPVVIDGLVREIAEDARLSDVVSADTVSVTTFDGKLIPRQQFARVPIPEGFDRNLSEINKGGLFAPDRGALLEQDVAWLRTVYRESFSKAPDATPRSVALNRTGELLVARNAPLPDGAPSGGRSDGFDYLVDVSEYPSRPPIGLYVLGENTPFTRYARRVFNLFFDGAYHQAQPLSGYTWICFHYPDNRWRYNPQRWRMGDCLTKFILAMHAHLEGAR